LAKEVRATAYIILGEFVRACSLLVVYWVSPEDVTKETLPRGLLEPLQVFQIIDCLQLW
jgi:hypothetical protein